MTTEALLNIPTTAHILGGAGQGVNSIFDAQRAASRADPEVPLALRRDRLRRLQAMLDADTNQLSAAVEADFGVRSPRLTEIADLLVLRSSISHSLRHVDRWMRPRRVPTPLSLQPARSFVQRQPLGVVGVVSPWNYPLMLALGPAASAMAAGNRVMIKPSELTPRTSESLAASVARHFATDELHVVIGDTQVAERFSGLPFDHLFFTGSTSVGRKVAAAAAANLTPTTLELGGKSPCIVDVSCDLGDAAAKIAHGKLLNAGQTCIAPDYVLVPRSLETEFADAFIRAAATMFGSFAGNPDYAALISARHRARLDALVEDAQARGARIRHLGPAGSTEVAGARQMTPILVSGAPPDAALLRDEVFGPVLPLVAYDSLDDAIGYVNARPRPLALYWFGRDTAARDRVLGRTVSGGVTINDTLAHVAHAGLPFGGVGDSGWGTSHGEAGFLRFTHQKSVLVQSRLGLTRLLYPPYGKRFDCVMTAVRRL